ncbi:MAG TPA: PfkB family carbohydrate kinase [Candidatus Bipolaricaulota bacterium]
MRLICVGDLMAELVVRPPNAASLGGEAPATFVTRAGGQALNVARAARRVGGQSILHAAVGSDVWGRWLTVELRRLGIGAKLQVTLEPTGLVLSLAATGQRTMYAQRGANAHLKLARIRLPKHGALYLSGYLLGNPDADREVVRLLNEAQGRGLLTAVDTPPADILSALGAERFLAAFSKAKVLFTTQEEGQRLVAGGALEQVATELARRFPLVVIKLGAQGCWVQQGADGDHVPTTPLEPVDATGAGDAFCGGFLVAQGQGQPPLEAAAFAHRVAAETIMASSDA